MLIDRSDIWQEFQDVYLLVFLAMAVLWLPVSAVAAGAANIFKLRRLPLPLLLTGYWCSLTCFLAAWVRVETFKTSRGSGPFIMAGALVVTAVFIRAHLRGAPIQIPNATSS
jgi:hypothetical protein